MGSNREIIQHESLGTDDMNDPTSDGHPQISIVIPTRNSARTLARCLSSIKAQTLPCEVVVVDNDSMDETIEIARNFGYRVVRGGPERSAQRNIGLSLCNGTVVGFIDSDMILDPEVAEEVNRLIDDSCVAVVVPEYTSGSGYWTSVRAFERSMYLENQNVEAARFFRKSVVDQIHGFNEQLTGGEDWDLEIRVRDHGTIRRTDAQIEHDEGRLQYIEACKKKGYYAKGYAKFAQEHGVRKLISITFDRPYIKSPKVLISTKGIGLIALKLGELVAILSVVMRQLVLDNTTSRFLHNAALAEVSSSRARGFIAHVRMNVCVQDREDT